ncbi:hypothetical protein [Paenibacillus sp. UNC451MF]|uniref:hypothetical protein n=1 Tax=Paenibacillus sp. UNC451MF TaxID=1449063 RepID=UPI00048F8724|nr:hypothetical protein [Paenibacillus sp. UNC451MF]
MTAVLLQHAICKQVESIIATMALETPKNGDRVPCVHAGYLPQQRSSDEDNSDIPYILVRVVSGEDDIEQGTVRIKLLFGTHSREDDGFFSTLNLMEKVRQGLLKSRTVDDKYRMEMPYKWHLFEDQPYPEWIGEAETIWTVPTIIEEVQY